MLWQQKKILPFPFDINKYKSDPVIMLRHPIKGQLCAAAFRSSGAMLVNCDCSRGLQRNEETRGACKGCLTVWWKRHLSRVVLNQFLSLWQVPMRWILVKLILWQDLFILTQTSTSQRHLATVHGSKSSSLAKSLFASTRPTSNVDRGGITAVLAIHHLDAQLTQLSC